jgi:hypothetical protein
VRQLIEGVAGKTIAELEVIDVNECVDLELRFTDGTCLHVQSKARAEMRVVQFDKDGEPRNPQNNAEIHN